MKNTLSLIATAMLIACGFQPSPGIAAFRSGFPLMLTESDPRMMALGGAAITSSGRFSNGPANPALAFGSAEAIQISYSRQMLDIWNGRVTYGRNWRDYFISGYITNYDYGSFEETLPETGPTGRSFDAGEYLIGLLASGDLFGLGSWGVGVKHGWWTIDGEKASTQAIDLGLTFDPNWERVKLGAVLKNYPLTGGYDEPGSGPPTEFSLAASKRLDHLPLTLFGVGHLCRSGEGDRDIESLPGSPGFAFGAGGEFEISPKGAKSPFNLRFGYQSMGQGLRVGNSKDLLAGFSFGFGMKAQRLLFDYTYVPMGAFDDLHRFAITGFLK
jgi:hypothetical protein